MVSGVDTQDIMSDPKTKEVYLDYYAVLRDRTGKSRERFKTTASTASELYREIRELYQLGLNEDQLRVAINDSFEAWPTVLKSGDRVVFIPPVSGGSSYKGKNAYHCHWR